MQDEVLQDSPSHEKVLQNDSSPSDRWPHTDQLQDVMLDNEPLRRAGALYRKPGTIGHRLLRFDGEPGHYKADDRICARWDDGVHIYPTNPPTGSAIWMYNGWVPRCFSYKYTKTPQPTWHRIPRQTTTARHRAFTDPIARKMLETLTPTRNRIPWQTTTLRPRVFSDSIIREMPNVAASITDQRWVHVEFDSTCFVPSSGSFKPRGNVIVVDLGGISDLSAHTSDETEEVPRSVLSLLWKPRRKTNRKSKKSDGSFQGMATKPVLGDRTTTPAAEVQGTKRKRSSEVYHGDDEMSAKAKRSKDKNAESTEDSDYPDRMALGSEDHSHRAEDSPLPC
ncbi:MAG: hypothetical protein Q9212_005310 [Teloschistes hypoglaucus]